MTYSESWLSSSEFFLHPKQQQHPKQVQPTFLIPCLCITSFRRLWDSESQERGFFGRCGRLELTKGWTGQAGRSWMSKSHCLASHALLCQSVTQEGSGRHHSLMTTFAVKMQVLKQTLVRNLQLLPACHFHVLHIARICFYISCGASRSDGRYDFSA